MERNYNITVEAASLDISMNPKGEERKIELVNNIDSGCKGLILVTDTNILRNNLGIKFDYCVCLDKQNRVVKIENNPVFSVNRLDSTYNYLLAPKNEDLFSFKSNFKCGDVVKFRIDGEICNCDEIESVVCKREMIMIDVEDFFTTSSDSISIDVSYKNLKPECSYSLCVDNIGCFDKCDKKIKLNLRFGVNLFKLVLKRDSEDVDLKNLIIYRRQKNDITKDNILWFDQHPSALFLNSEEQIDRVLSKVKDLGFTSCALVVKGTEGYVSYKKATLTNSPYVSDIKVEYKKGVDPSRDLLEDFIVVAKKYGLKVYAAINVMTEGNLKDNDCPLIKNHPDWEEMIQRPEDRGAILTVRESIANNILLYINPNNDEAVDFQLKRYEEIMMNYDVDGIVLDRCRYDNKYADFSELTRVKFEQYLLRRNKKLEHWPSDVFEVQKDGTVVEGPLCIEWWIFRCEVITSIVKKIRKLVDKCSALRNINFSLSGYVGAWYELMYENGLNWGSKSFRYDKRYCFAEDRIYTEDYIEISYLDQIDFLMIGSYYKTKSEINRYITLGNIVVQEEVPLIGGLSLYDIDKNADLHDVYTSVLEKTDGTMTFDACKLNLR